MSAVNEVEVVNRTDEHRYVATLHGRLVGAAFYDRAEDLVTFTHTEVDDAVEGHGVGSALVGYALDDVRSLGLRVVPQCPFVRGYLERHPDYRDLVAE